MKAYIQIEHRPSNHHNNGPRITKKGREKEKRAELDSEGHAPGCWIWLRSRHCFSYTINSNLEREYMVVSRLSRCHRSSHESSSMKSPASRSRRVPVVPLAGAVCSRKQSLSRRSSLRMAFFRRGSSSNKASR